MDSLMHEDYSQSDASCAHITATYDTMRNAMRFAAPLFVHHLMHVELPGPQSLTLPSVWACAL